jgi:hypothetical protein
MFVRDVWLSICFWLELAFGVKIAPADRSRVRHAINVGVIFLALQQSGFSRAKTTKEFETNLNCNDQPGKPYSQLK